MGSAYAVQFWYDNVDVANPPPGYVGTFNPTQVVPKQNEQVTVQWRLPNGTVQSSLFQSDSNGCVVGMVPLSAGGNYIIKIPGCLNRLITVPSGQAVYTNNLVHMLYGDFDGNNIIDTSLTGGDYALFLAAQGAYQAIDKTSTQANDKYDVLFDVNRSGFISPDDGTLVTESGTVTGDTLP